MTGTSTIQTGWATQSRIEATSGSPLAAGSWLSVPVAVTSFACPRPGLTLLESGSHGFLRIRLYGDLGLPTSFKSSLPASGYD